MVSIGDHGTLIDSKKCEKIGNEGHGMVRYSNSALPCSVSYIEIAILNNIELTILTIKKS